MKTAKETTILELLGRGPVAVSFIKSGYRRTLRKLSDEGLVTIAVEKSTMQRTATLAGELVTTEAMIE